MKVRIAVTLDIDPEMWTLNYGVEGAGSIRADVVSWAHDLLHEAARERGALR